MAYLQPWMLWALPAVLLPIIIHLLNRLRYKTVHWAAMLFLLKANRAATRRAKIRQYILLALRCLVLLFLIWAMARPLVGGWLGSAAGGAPEAVVLLLDRSASMEAHAGQPESKRAHALALLSQAAAHSVGSHFVLIENVLRQPLELADASKLGTLQMCEATDTAADLPAMFRAALDHLAKNKPGSAEIWVASDLQASNWHPDSPEWQDIGARFNGLAQNTRVRVLDLSSPPANNLSLNLKNAEMRIRDEKSARAQLSLTLQLDAQGERRGTLPLLLTRDGAKSQVDIPLKAAVQRQTLKFDLPKIESGWGKLELPADDNPADNTAYFAYAPPVPLRAAIVADGTAAQRLQIAAAPDRSRGDRTAEIIPAARAASIPWKDTAFIVWAAPAPEEAVSKSLQSWVEAGGVILCFPPAGEASAGPLGVTWSKPDDAAKAAPFRVASWDDLDGPLARTESGASLPLPRLEIARRRLPHLPQPGHVSAAFADGQPFLLSQKLGSGQIFSCATLPDGVWSSLGEGTVLLPLVQRLLTLGSRRLAPPLMAIAGEWRPPDPTQAWTSIETDRRRDWRWHAGVYRHGTQLVALNRPEIEDSPELVDRARLPALLRGVNLTVMAGALELKADQLQSEIWPAMLMLTMLLMCAEMALATSKAMLPLKAAARTGVPGPAASRKPAEAAA